MSKNETLYSKLVATGMRMQERVEQGTIAPATAVVIISANKATVAALNSEMKRERLNQEMEDRKEKKPSPAKAKK